MKKALIITATMLLALSGMVKAQDTLVSLLPAPNCYYNNWVDGKNLATWWWMSSDNYLLLGQYFYVDDSLPVYGIAASLGYMDDLAVEDSSMANVYEYLGLYEPEMDTLRHVGDSLYVHLGTTPVTYYFQIGQTAPSSWGEPNVPQPVYELYYSEPVMVYDSFYVGITQRSWNYIWGENWTPTGMYENHPVRVVGYGQFPYHPVAGRKVVYREILEGPQYLYQDSNSLFPLSETAYLFPILAPYTPDTTIIVDTTVVDTLGLSARVLERYVNLLPNPAAERVQVVSSFGLQGVEVYNAASTKVMEHRFAGLTAVLDIAALPEGTYILRVHTPSGSVTKKLLVQRR